MIIDTHLANYIDPYTHYPATYSYSHQGLWIGVKVDTDIILDCKWSFKNPSKVLMEALANYTDSLVGNPVSSTSIENDIKTLL